MTLALQLAWLLFPKRFAAVLLLTAAALLVVLLALMGVAAQLRRPASPFPSPANAGTFSIAANIPLEQLPVIMDTAAASSCGVPWNLLASVAQQESNFGRNPDMFQPHDGGILGYGQFSPSSWAAYGQGGDIMAYQDALPAMARYLCALGVQQDPWLALMLYSGCNPRQATCHRVDGYADQVLARAGQYASVATTADLAGKVADVFEIAAGWLGFPYRLGGTGLSPLDGIDCSALVQQVFGQVGISLPRTAQTQYQAVAKIAAKDAQPGDLLFFTATYDSPDFITHVGIYQGIVDGAPRMIDASGAAVRYDNPFAGFWAQHLVSAGRP